jgi:hypothetical protein
MGIKGTWKRLGKNAKRSTRTSEPFVPVGASSVAIELAGLGSVMLGKCLGKSQARSETIARHVHQNTPMEHSGPAVRAAKSMIDTITGKRATAPT